MFITSTITMSTAAWLANIQLWAQSNVILFKAVGAHVLALWLLWLLCSRPHLMVFRQHRGERP